MKTTGSDTPHRRCCLNRDDGFSLIELLTVLIVLGVLASISIPSFIAQTDRGRSAAVLADLRGAATAIESTLTTSGAYPADQAAFDAMSGVARSAGVTLEYVLVDAATFCVRGSHADIGGGAVVASWDSGGGGLQPGAAC